MPTRRARTPSQYQEEYVAFIDRVTNEFGDIGDLGSNDAWLEHVRLFVMGGLEEELSAAQTGFFQDAFSFMTESLTSAEIVLDTAVNRFRDVATGRFISRADVRTYLRRVPYIGGLLQG